MIKKNHQTFMLRLLCLFSMIEIGLNQIASASSPGFSWHIQGGQAWVNFQNQTQNLTTETDTINQYNTNSYTKREGIVGAGISYQWNYSHKISLNLGLSGDYLKTNLSGINSPLINGGHFDTLNYSVTGQSYAILLEPKLIFSTYSWQPYLLTGLGVSFNHFGNYFETQSDSNGSATATSTPFNNQTKTNFAYELGLGIQHPFNLTLNPILNPILALDYRYMDLGKTGLSTYPNQPSSNTLSFGHLKTSSINLSLIWKF